MSNDQQQSDRTPASEWALGVVGALVAVGLLTFLTYQGLVRDIPPRLDVVVLEVHETPSGFLTSLRVENSGGQTASGAHVTGEITQGGVVVSTAETTISYVPPSSRREATLIFSEDPRDQENSLEVVVTGYTPM